MSEERCKLPPVYGSGHRAPFETDFVAFPSQKNASGAINLSHTKNATVSHGDNTTPWRVLDCLPIRLCKKTTEKNSELQLCGNSKALREREVKSTRLFW